MQVYIVTAKYKLVDGSWQDCKPAAFSTRKAAEADAKFVREICWQDVVITEVTLDKR
jgi:hypothetical protein